MKEQKYIAMTNEEYQFLKDKRGFYMVVHEIRFADYNQTEECFDITSYYKDDKLHRVDGPALKNAKGLKEYYIKGNQISKRELVEKLSRSSLKSFLLNSENY